MSELKRSLFDVVETIVTGEFYMDYDQSSSDLGVLRQALVDQGVMANLKIQLMEAEKKVAKLPKEIEYNVIRDQYIEDYLENIHSVVIADSYARHQLWAEYSKRDGVTWVAEGSGYLVTVGRFYDMPVCLSITLVVINDKRIIFADPTSTVVNHDMIREWVKRYVTPEKNPIDATNFHNALR